MNVEVHIRPRNSKPLKVGDEVFQSAYDWKLTEKDLEKAARELGETNEKKEACLRELKEKLSKESSANYRQDDFYLLRFLRVRKYNVPKAYQNVKSFYEHRKKNPDLFTLAPELKSAQELNFITSLPYTDEEGRIIFLLNFNRWNIREKSFEEMIRTATTLSDIASLNPRCQINGIFGIYDMTGLTLKHIAEVLWSGRLWACTSLVQNGYPWRIKKLLVFNTTRVVRILYNIIRPMVKNKIVERCVLLGSDIDELHQYVNPALLPKRLNGSLEERECDVSQHILNNLPYIRYERSFTFPSKN